MKEDKFERGIYSPTTVELALIRQWIEELKNNKFFPYHKVEEELTKEENSVMFIHGIMDDGKSFKHWQYVLKHYLENGERTQVLYPSTDAMEEEMVKFLDEFQTQAPQLWDCVTVINLNDKGTQKGVLYKGHIMAYVNSISTLKKTSRDSRVKWIHIDEYNQHDTRVRNQYIEKYNILLSRNMRGVNKVFMGNNVTTDHVLLHRYNIYSLPDGMNHIPIEYKDRDKKWQTSKFNVVVWNFKRNDDEIFEKYKDIPEFYELNMEDFGSHAFYNESRNDQRDFIVNLDMLMSDPNAMQPKYLIQSRIGVLEVYKTYFLDKWYFYIRYDKKAERELGEEGFTTYVLNKEFEASGYIASKDMRDYFYNLKGNKGHKFRYQNASVAQAFQEQLTRG